MSDDEIYDDIDIDYDEEIDAFDEIDDPDNINFEDVKDEEDPEREGSEIDEESDLEELEEIAEELEGQEEDLIIDDYFHKVVDHNKEDFISSMSLHPRDIIVVKPENRRTRRSITKKEFARVLGIRTKLIALYAKVFTDVTNLTDPKLMALKEIKDRKCPISIRREIGINKENKKIVEIWSVNEMEIPF